RGPNSNSADSINLVVYAPSPLSGGIPVTLSIPVAGVTYGSVSVQYNTSLLVITGAFSNPALGNATFTLDAASTPGNAILDFNSPAVLPPTNVVLGGLIAYVPATAPYRAKQILQISSVIQGGAISSINDNSV